MRVGVIHGRDLRQQKRVRIRNSLLQTYVQLIPDTK